eukprot:5662288-Heterocapsa_arctica.AAC.1
MRGFCMPGAVAAKVAGVSGPLREQPAGYCAGFHATAPRLLSRKDWVLAAIFRCRLGPALRAR